MNRKNTAPIPEAITQFQRQLDRFRSTRPARTKLPEPLWQAAVELARQHGIYAVAHPLGLDYTFDRTLSMNMCFFSFGPASRYRGQSLLSNKRTCPSISINIGIPSLVPRTRRQHLNEARMKLLNLGETARVTQI